MTFSKTVNLGNSIIGVSILAMPYCFVQSGVLLSILLILLSGFLTRLSCHFLLKSAFISRRRSFELMVHDVLGSTGRLLVELGLIGFLLGTCVAYFIMIGDIAPKILIELLNIEDHKHLRLVTVLALSIFVALPLSLLRRVDSLTSFSLLSMLLYSFLILKLMFETNDKIKVGTITPNKFDEISYWNISGLLTTFPIFSMAMSCQTSLFEIFDSSTINNDLETIRRDNNIIKKAIYMCTFVYITVGLLGYMAFHEQKLYGNLLLAFPPSTTTTLTKIGFIVTLLMSFPLCLFPCRTSVHSLTVGKSRKSASFQPLPTTSPATTLVGFDTTGITVNNGYTSSIKVVECDNKDKNNNRHQGSSTFAMSRSSSNGDSQGVEMMPNSKSYTKLLDADEIAWNYDKMQANGVNTDSPDAQPSRLYITDFQFRLLTVILIALTVILSLMFPHIEFILGIIGSTAGTTVCFVLPSYTFIKIGEHSKMELYMARLLLLIGLAMLIFCSYSTIYKAKLDDHNE